MVASGICHTDLFFADTAPAEPYFMYPRVVGHEGSGYVKEVGKSVTVARPGDPVLLSFSSCGACALCKSELPGYCCRFNDINFRGAETFATGNGKPDIFGGFFGQSSFASMAVVSEKSVVHVKDLIRNEDELKLFAPLGCGIQTGCGTVTNVSGAGPNDVLVVLGLGGVGLSAILGARIKGVKNIIGIDRIPERIALAKELGATVGIDTSGFSDLELLVAAVQKASPDGLGASVTIETTGKSFIVEVAMKFSRPRGKVIQVGSGGAEIVQIGMQDFMGCGKQYIGAVEGDATPSRFVPEMIQWYRDGQLPLEKFVKFFGAEDFKVALEQMHRGAEAVKPIIIW